MNRKNTATLLALGALLALAGTASAADRQARFERAGALRAGQSPAPVVESVSGTASDSELNEQLGRRSPGTPTNPVLTQILVPVSAGETIVLRGVALSRFTADEELVSSKPMFRRPNLHVHRTAVLDDLENGAGDRVDNLGRKANFAVSRVQSGAADLGDSN